MGGNNPDIPIRYFYRPVWNLIWSGVAIFEISNFHLKLLHIIYSIVFISIFAWGYIITEVIHLIKHKTDMEEITLTLCYLIAHCIGILKIIVLLWKRKLISSFLVNLEQGLFLPNEQRGGLEEANIIKIAVIQTSRQAKTFFVLVISMLVNGAMPALAKRAFYLFSKDTNGTIISEFPYPSTLPFNVDEQQSPCHEILLFYQIFSIALFGWYLGNADVIVTGLMIHVTAQFKIVANALLTVTNRAERMTHGVRCLDGKRNQNRNVINDDNNSKEDIKKYDEIFARNLKTCIKACVKHHIAILQLLDDMEITFNFLLLIQFLGFLLTICVGLYQSSVVPVNSSSFLSMSSFTAAMLFQLLIYCWNGNELTLHSGKVSEAAYDCQWISADKDVQKSLLLIMMRAQRPCHLTAGKFVYLSLETFIKVFKSASSFFMVLRKMNEEE